MRRCVMHMAFSGEGTQPDAYPIYVERARRQVGGSTDGRYSRPGGSHPAMRGADARTKQSAPNGVGVDHLKATREEASRRDAGAMCSILLFGEAKSGQCRIIDTTNVDECLARVRGVVCWERERGGGSARVIVVY